jgi:gamma-glutamyltranspeptidase/glutathione hydrolase
MRKRSLAAAACIGIAMAAAAPLDAADRLTDREFAMLPVIATYGTVACAHPLASPSARPRTGNAIDAAIAVNAALGLMEPTSRRRRDLFAIVWDAVETLRLGMAAAGRRRACASKTGNVARKSPARRSSVTVPGAVDGWLSCTRSASCRCRSARAGDSLRARGRPVPPVIAFYWQRGVTRYADYPEWQATYAPNGKRRRKATFLQPRSGEDLRGDRRGAAMLLQRRDGEADRRRGAVYGGGMTADDLAAHTSTWVEPLSTNYRGYDVGSRRTPRAWRRW